MRPFILCIALLSLCGQVRAAEPVPAELLSEFTETYQPEVAVSGSVIVGVMSAAAQRALGTDRLGVLVSETVTGREVCVRAISNDGIYSSRNHYRLPASAGVQAHLPYISGMEEVLDAFAVGELAVSVTAGNCQTTAAETYLVAGNLDDADSTPVIVYLNGFGATDVFVIINEEGPPEPCQYITLGRRTTYDFSCAVSVPPGQAPTLTFIRERFGREQPEITIRLLGMSG